MAPSFYVGICPGGHSRAEPSWKVKELKKDGVAKTVGHLIVYLDDIVDDMLATGEILVVEDLAKNPAHLAVFTPFLSG